jgi:hypothetical protein
VGALATFLRGFVRILSKRLASYELIPADVRRRGGFPFLSAAFTNARRRLLPGPRPVVSGIGREVYGSLGRDGICVLRVDPRLHAAVASEAAPILEQLRQSRGQRKPGGRDFMESRASALRSSNASLFRAVDEMLKGSGALDGISAYVGRQARLIDVNPQINDVSDDFWARIFPDMPAEDRPCSYVHKDASGGDIKAMIYLSDVSERSGPFTFTVGSHPPRRTRLTDWIEEANDQSGLSGTEPRARAAFIALPRLLRRKCAFGNDVRAGSDLARRICMAEWPITASKGHLVMFDTKGYHRGGMVTEGERVVITCVIG